MEKEAETLKKSPFPPPLSVQNAFKMHVETIPNKDPLQLRIIFYLPPFQSNYLTVSYAQKVPLMSIAFFFTNFSYIFYDEHSFFFRSEEVFDSNTLMITLNLYFCLVSYPPVVAEIILIYGKVHWSTITAMQK